MYMNIRVFIIIIAFLGCHQLNSQDLFGFGNCDEEYGSTFTVELAYNCPTEVYQGDVVCVDLIVNNWDPVEIFQFTQSWNPYVLEYISNPIMSTILPPLGNPFNVGVDGVNEILADEGNLGVIISTLDPATSNAVTLPDGTILLRTCFNVIGEPGTNSLITFTDNLTQLDEPEISTTPIGENSSCNLDWSLETCTIRILCDDLSIQAGWCDSPDSGPNGSANFTACGGTPPYNWEINGQTGTSNGEQVFINNIPPGTQTLLVTDDTGSTTTASIVISQSNSPLSASPLIIENPLCVNRPDRGTITLDESSVNGGTPPYTYAWSNFEFNVTEIDRQEPGDYELTITDANGCNLILPATLEIDTLKVTATVIQDANCEDGGTILLEATGGTPNASGEYFYNGLNLGVTYTETNWPGNSWYYYQVEDFAAPRCTTVVDSVWIEEIGSPTLSIEIDSISCFGSNDASFKAWLNNSAADFPLPMVTDQDGNILQMVVGGGDPDNGIPDTISNFNPAGLSPGKYFITITERIFDPTIGAPVDGCTLDTCLIITEPTELQIGISNDPPSCLGNDGKIYVSATGGTEPYTYTWDGAFEGDTLCDLMGGIYNVTVTDANGCTDETSLLLPDGSDDQIDIAIIVVNPVSCFEGEDADLQVAVFSGGGPFDYAWEDEDGILLSTTPNLTNVGAGEYYVTVTDPGANCRAIDTFNLIQPPSLEVDINVIQPDCVNISNGRIEITPLSGPMPFTYLWENNTTLPILPALSADEYCVTITDANNCSIDTCIVLMSLQPPVELSIDQIFAAECTDEDTGSVQVSASGGNGGPLYSFTAASVIDGSIISTGTSTSPFVLENLPVGEVVITVSDLTCPSESETITIPNTAPLSLDQSFTTITEPTCAGASDGSATIQALGGAGAYTYIWQSDNSTGNTNNNLSAGIQYITINDANGCTMLDSIEIGQPDSLIASINTFLTFDISCASSNDGSIAIDVIGGNQTGYTYTWDPDVSDNNFASNLGLGTYTVTVSDELGCSDTVSYTMTSAPPITAVVATPEMPECFGGTTCISIASASGGQGGPYTFTIADGGFNIPIDSCVEVISDTFDIKVFDGSSGAACFWSTSLYVPQPDEIVVAFDASTVETALGDSNITVTVDYDTQLPLDTILWSPEGIVECQNADCSSVSVFPTVTTDLTATVIDENGCDNSASIQVIIDDTRLVYFPNAFSPNQDGVNDDFTGFFGEGVRAVEFFNVFDRWGNLIYAEEGIANGNSLTLDGWDGKFKGEKLDPGVYVYHSRVSFVDDRIIDYKGSFTLLQ